MKMICGIASILVLLLASLATVGVPLKNAQADETLEPYVKTMWATKRANVRTGPSTNHDKIELLEAGEIVVVVGKIGNWFKLNPWSDQSERFVYAPLLSETEPAVSTPAVSQSAVKTINYSNGDRYRGQIRDGRRHGRGVYTWASGGSYDGEWRNGDFHGRGVRTWANGDRYEGDFVEDKATGRGVYTYADGRRYEGDLVDLYFQGRGVMTWPNGNRYEGDFVRNKRTGRGVFTWPNGHRYAGDFVDGQFNGAGIYTLGDAGSYAGKFVDGGVTDAFFLIRADGSAVWAYMLPDGPQVLDDLEGAEEALLIWLQSNALEELLERQPQSRTTQSRQHGAHWGAYIEAGDYGEGEQGYGLAWNYPNPQAALRAAYRECLKGNSYDECGGNDLTRSYGFQYWVFSTSRMPAGVRRFPNRHEDDGLSKSYYRFDVEDSVFAVFYVQQRCIAVYGAGPEGSFSAWDLDREFGNSEVEVRRKIYHDHPIKAVACNKL